MHYLYCTVLHIINLIRWDVTCTWMLLNAHWQDKCAHVCDWNVFVDLVVLNMQQALIQQISVLSVCVLCSVSTAFSSLVLKFVCQAPALVFKNRFAMPRKVNKLWCFIDSHVTRSSCVRVCARARSCMLVRMCVLSIHYVRTQVWVCKWETKDFAPEPNAISANQDVALGAQKGRLEFDWLFTSSINNLPLLTWSASLSP